MFNLLKRFGQAFRYDIETLEENSRTIMMVVGGMYIAFHCLATLGWSQIFNPALWPVSILMALVLGASLYFLERWFILSQLLWFAGLSAAIALASLTFNLPEISLGLALLPLMAVMMTGIAAAAFVELGIIGLLIALGRLPPAGGLPDGYVIAGILVSLALFGLGWGLSLNLLKAVESANFHYNEARANLEEVREHRAKISLLLDNISRANYQLDRLNQMLSYAREKAEKAYEERSRFAMAVSHELRSPLNFIIGFSDLMVNTPEVYSSPEDWPPGLYEDIRQIYRSSTHLLALINDILDMGKIDARQMVLFREKVDLADLLEEVQSMVEAAVSSKELWLRIETQPGLPEMYIDRTRIRQVLINLVTNSLNFTQRGGITMRAYTDGPGKVRIEVEDSGAGISGEDIPQLFQEFRQVGQRSWRRSEGSGLGLAIGRRFIKLHNGEMGVTSQPGKGSVFYFTLPVAQPGVEELGDWEALEELLSAPPGESASAPHLQNGSETLLLFVSTDIFWARIFGETVSGYKVALINHPAQLRSTVEKLYPRGVIVDVALADNPLVAEFIAHPPYDLPIIKLAIPVNLNRVTNLPEGVERYLLKPVSRQVLFEAITQVKPQARSVLVVDDDPSMVRFVEQSLRTLEGTPWAGRKLRILSAENGLQALEVMHAETVDLLLLDIDLPGMDGLEVMEKMRGHPVLRKIPVIIISANDLPHHLSLDLRGIFEVRSQHLFTSSELNALLQAVLQAVETSYAQKEG